MKESFIIYSIFRAMMTYSDITSSNTEGIFFREEIKTNQPPGGFDAYTCRRIKPWKIPKQCFHLNFSGSKIFRTLRFLSFNQGCHVEKRFTKFYKHLFKCFQRLFFQMLNLIEILLISDENGGGIVLK